MSVAELGARLERLPDVLARHDLYESKGIGNEVNFHVFAYPPEAASVVEGYVPRLVQRLADKGLQAFVFDVFQEMIAILRESGHLEQALDLERDKGTPALAKAVRKMLHAQALAARLQERRREQPHDVILISGVGGAYPLVRAHQLLNNLHSDVEDVPLVLLYPGSYDGTAFRLFERLDDENHYRAFVLVEQVD
ncbi:MAG: DUF1788 domain-containing protein [Trueperaceae bacterium]|nr:DUF1788 domain-containing protein [Trueperaceae bacterium]